MLEKAVSELANGRIVLLHDSSGREDEVDMVIHASSVTWETVRAMRHDGGGLICLALGGPFAKKLDLPFIADMMAKFGGTPAGMVPKKTAYGDKPAFSLSVNHRKTYTGVTDRDRALTITEFAKLKTPKQLVRDFYTPGHVHLLISRGIEHRRGHTELSTELAKRAGLTEAVVLCEMMSDDGDATTVEEAGKYAKTKCLVLLDGGEL